MEAEISLDNVLQPHLLAFDIRPKKCHFQPFQRSFSTVYMFVYIPYSISDYIWANLNFQKNRVILF